jgi:hypothetical protein
MAVYAHKPGRARAYSFAWVTGAMFLAAWVGQFAFQWIETARDSAAHGETLTLVTFLPTFLSATFENWQSEFLQLVWQAAGLALFYYWGSSQSRESDERLEAKVDTLLRQAGVNPASVTQDPVQQVERSTVART